MPTAQRKKTISIPHPFLDEGDQNADCCAFTTIYLFERLRKESQPPILQQPGDPLARPHLSHVLAPSAQHSSVPLT